MGSPWERRPGATRRFTRRSPRPLQALAVYGSPSAIIEPFEPRLWPHSVLSTSGGAPFEFRQSNHGITSDQSSPTSSARVCKPLTEFTQCRRVRRFRRQPSDSFASSEHLFSLRFVCLLRANLNIHHVDPAEVERGTDARPRDRRQKFHSAALLPPAAQR